MQHIHRRTTLDAHHSILPLTGRVKIDPAPFFVDAIPLSSHAQLAILAPVDMILHSATHLFMNEEFSHGLRDLSDLDLLMRQFADREEFWDELARRARMLNLARPLYYALRYTGRILGTPVPQAAIDSAAGDGPGKLLGAAMDALWFRALQTQHASVSDSATRIALFLLYLRAHWMRMPFFMLIAHLSVKAVMRLKPKKEMSQNH